MSKQTITPIRIPDRLSYLWLALSAALYPFTGGLWVIPLAAWLASLLVIPSALKRRWCYGPAKPPSSNRLLGMEPRACDVDFPFGPDKLALSQQVRVKP